MACAYRTRPNQVAHTLENARAGSTGVVDDPLSGLGRMSRDGFVQDHSETDARQGDPSPGYLRERDALGEIPKFSWRDAVLTPAEICCSNTFVGAMPY